jgi:tight adherence protein B
MDQQTLLIIIVAVIGFAVVLAVGFVFAGGRTSQETAVKRARTIGGASGRDATRRLRSQPTATAETRRKQIVKSLQDHDRVQKKMRLNLRNKLYQAGLSFTVVQFWMGSVGFGFLIFVILILMRAPPLVAIGLGGAAAAGLPQWILGFLAKRRTAKFTSGFSEAMDIIVRGIKSGLPVHDCIRIIGRETAQPLSGEFQRLVENIGVGMTFDVALEKFYERMPTAEVRFFAIVMTIQAKTGGNLAEALNNLSVVLRARKLMKEKVKALSAEATSSAMIIGCLPPGVITMIMVTQPSYMQPMFVDHRGWFMLGASAFWMATGVFVMVRMINFKF